MTPADLLISRVLDEGRKRPILAIVGGRRDPRFGRKARRFGSKAPLIDKGGEPSVVDKFSTKIKLSTPKDDRPNSRVREDNPLGYFGPPANNQHRRDRHAALIHVMHHLHKMRSFRPLHRIPITTDHSNPQETEHNGIKFPSVKAELLYHRDRLIDAEVRSMHRMARRTFLRSTGFHVTNTSDDVYDPSKEANKSHIINTVGNTSTDQPMVADALGNVETRLHDVQDHSLLGALPTEKGELMVDMLNGLRRDAKNKKSLEKLPVEAQNNYFNNILNGYKEELLSVYKRALASGATKNDVHEHDPMKVLEMARRIKGGVGQS